MAWPIVQYNGIEYYQAEGMFLVPVDPSTGVAIIMLKRDGGIGSGFSAIETGPPGMHAEIDETINFTALAWDDPTPDSASWTELAPPSESSPGVYRLNLALHTGEPGTDGASVLNPASFGTPVAKRMIVVKSDLSGFEFQAQKVADRYLPAAITESGPAQANSTLAPISIPALPFDWRPHIEAHSIKNGADTLVDLVARLNGETGGNVVARCRGIAATERLTIVSAPQLPASDTFDKVLAGQPATIHIRTELQSGAGSYITTDTWCSVRPQPIP